MACGLDVRVLRRGCCRSGRCGAGLRCRHPGHSEKTEVQGRSATGPGTQGASGLVCDGCGRGAGGVREAAPTAALWRAASATAPGSSQASPAQPGAPVPSHYDLHECGNRDGTHLTHAPGGSRRRREGEKVAVAGPVLRRRCPRSSDLERTRRRTPVPASPEAPLSL